MASLPLVKDKTESRLCAAPAVYLPSEQHSSKYQMNDRLQELTIFVRVGESGSFTRAARDMNLSQPSVSRIIGELETRLGVKLLLRTTRRLTLTAAGEKFLERARDILAELDNAEDAARGVDSLRGTYGSRFRSSSVRAKSFRACPYSWTAIRCCEWSCGCPTFIRTL
jgi:molybdenum-dependent DNA-binding transcriptional regulator ModE